MTQPEVLRKGIACGEEDALRKLMGRKGLCQPVRPSVAAGERALLKKKRPAPEGAGLPGVVPFDIVNWEGNYILDTNTFLIVIPHQ
jgi:hypothetical protein